MAAEEFLSRHGVGRAREEAGCLLAEARWAGEVVLVARPQAFMNLSGPPVLAISRRYSATPSDLILAHDDADLPFGMVRIRPDGRPAGHRGVASIVEAMGTEAIPRLRMGVGRPAGESDLADYVLDEFEASEEAPLREMIETATDAVEVLLREGVKSAMNSYNRRRGPEPQQA